MAGRAIEWQIGPLPRVRGDATLLRTVLANLLSNAIKYSRNRDLARIEIGSETRSGAIICYVKDNGAGFDMRFVDKLFGVFQRLHPPEQFEERNQAASVRRIVHRHGGRVWAKARWSARHVLLLADRSTTDDGFEANLAGRG
jgi:light-regulated signal transduction histidine kinase (bacteriophytochrome)